MSYIIPKRIYEKIFGIKSSKVRKYCSRKCRDAAYYLRKKAGK